MRSNLKKKVQKFPPKISTCYNKSIVHLTVFYSLAPNLNKVHVTKSVLDIEDVRFRDGAIRYPCVGKYPVCVFLHVFIPHLGFHVWQRVCTYKWEYGHRMSQVLGNNFLRSKLERIFLETNLINKLYYILCTHLQRI